ncbi:MAG: ABC transporter permease [Chloroflexota bacterium]|nr:ABC transporter permease [Chloroflexota bacterium]
MSFWRTLKVAWEGLTLNKARSFLTTMGVIIGVAAVIVMMAVSAGAEAEIADQINALGANLIVVMPAFQRGGVAGGGRGSVGLEYPDDLEAIRRGVDGINGVSAEQSTRQEVKGDGNTLSDVSIVGTTADFPAVRDYQVMIGRFIADEDNERKNEVAVLGYTVAQELFGERSPVGQKLKIGSVNFVVIGVMEKKGVVGNEDYDARVYVPLTVIFKRYEVRRFGGDTLNTVLVSAESKNVMDEVMDQITVALAREHGVQPSEADFNLMTQESVIDAAASTTEAFRNLLGWVAGVSLVVGGIGIMNIMLVSVTERTREIGLRQALGARPRDVRLQFLLEAIILSLIGGVVGVLAGVGGSYLFGELGTMRTAVVPMSVPLAFVAAAAVGIFFGYYPATQAAQLDPIDALRHE